MWRETIEYLKDPQLVADIQEFFGVRIHYENAFDSDEKKATTLGNDDKFSADSNDAAKGKVEGNGCLIGDNGYRETEVSKKDCEVSCTNSPNYTITNYFWYYLFLLGTELGDELFYTMFIPFWFWNIDGAVGRRVVLVWATIMTIGQELKDFICWPRPTCPPAVRLQSKWSQEYGMPSTHAMVGVSIPFSVFLFTMNRYIYPFPIGLAIAVVWCTLVSISRLYLGMHTVLDVIVGLSLAILLMIPLVPLIDVTDYYFLTKGWPLLILIAVSVATVVYYPTSDRWTPTRGDTTMVVSVTAGVHVGAWLNYQTGLFATPILPPPYNIIWPSYPMMGRLILRTVLGFCVVIATKAIFKTFSYGIMCAILKVNSKELQKSENHLENTNKTLVDLINKYVTCFMIGVNTVFLLPNVFTMIGIERPTFHTEM